MIFPPTQNMLGDAPGEILNPERDPLLESTDAVVFGDTALTVAVYPIEAGVTWWREAASLVWRDPLRWMASALVFLVVCAATLLVPVIGPLVLHVVQTILIGGLCIGCRAVDLGEPFKVGMIFAGFRSEYLGRLTTMALALVGGFVLLFFVAGVLGLAFTVSELTGFSEISALPAILPGVLFLTLVITVFAMLYWFAPALIVLHGTGPIEAMKLSFMGSLKNIAPMLSFGIVALLLLLLGILTAGIGFLLIGPIAIATIYTSTRAVFGAARARRERV
jgi:uncharacterized membrane protein